MIKFPCVCGHVFEVETEQAGKELQCPKCFRLNDIPRRSELGQIGPDGIYRLGEPAPGPKTDVAADLVYVYQRGARDAEGNEIDLRLAPHEFDAIGQGKEIPLTPDGVAPKYGPRYDPETGELVTPLDVKHTDEDLIDPASIPMATHVLTYATAWEGMPRSAFPRLVHLFSPLNLIVMAGVFVLHIVLWPLEFVFFAGMVFIIVAIPFVAGAILAHYGNVIEDIGPHEHDELPRPMRDLGWYEDLWSPFVNLLASLILCYGPSAVLVAVNSDQSSVVAAATAVILGIVGTYLFPAVVLTLQCGSTFVNLRPDRLLNTISACGRDYRTAVFSWIVAGLLYAWGWGGSTAAMATVMQGSPLPFWLSSIIVTTPVLAVAIFATHFFAVNVGMLYRMHYPQFTWILQRHAPVHRTASAGLPPSRRKRGKYGFQPDSTDRTGPTTELHSGASAH